MTKSKFENFIDNDAEWRSSIELKVLDLEKELTEWRESRTRDPGHGSEGYGSPPRREREMLRARGNVQHEPRRSADRAGRPAQRARGSADRARGGRSRRALRRVSSRRRGRIPALWIPAL